MRMFRGWFQLSKWRPCLRNILLKSRVFLWAKGLNAKGIHKEMLPVYGDVRRVKRLTTGQQMFRWWRRGKNGGAEVAETTVKWHLCCGFRRNGKAMGQMYQCWLRICRELNVFTQVPISHALRLRPPSYLDLGYDRFLPNPFFFTFHLSFYHLTLYSPITVTARSEAWLSSPARTLGSWVRISLEAWMSLCFFCSCCPTCS
jgi:hypothetical protein